MMIYRVESTKPLPQVAQDFEAATQKHKFGVLGVHDLKGRLKEKGVDFGPDCLIYEVCNPEQAKRVLEANLQISTALPCRVSMYREGSGVTLATIRPTAMLEMFQTAELKAVAEEVEAAIFEIMDEAAR